MSVANNLEDHQRMSDKYSAFKCDGCDCIFELLGSLIKHNEMVHNHNFQKFNNTITPEMSLCQCIVF